MSLGPHRFLTPFSLFDSASKAHRAFKYAIVVAGIAVLIATVLRFGLSPATFVFGVVIVIVLMVLFLLFARAARVAEAEQSDDRMAISLAAAILLWTSLVLCVASAILLFLSAFFNKPLPLRDLIINFPPGKAPLTVLGTDPHHDGLTVPPVRPTTQPPFGISSDNEAKTFLEPIVRSADTASARAIESATATIEEIKTAKESESSGLAAQGRAKIAAVKAEASIMGYMDVTANSAHYKGQVDLTSGEIAGYGIYDVGGFGRWEGESHKLDSTSNFFQGFGVFYPDKKIGFSYAGHFVGGIMESGVQIWNDGHSKWYFVEKVRGQTYLGTYEVDDFVYNGEFKNGTQNGYGVEEQPDGQRYEGEMRNGRPNGYGTFHLPNKGIYKGELADGQFNGLGVMFSNDGSVIAGTWENGVLKGKGFRMVKEMITPAPEKK